jgi:hypothetical protein
MKKVLFTVLAGMVLAMPGMAQEFDHQIEALITGGGYELEENIPAMKINSFADLINKRPAMPTANDLITPEAKTAYARKGSAAYYLGALNFRSTLLEKQQELNSKTLELGKKQQKSNQKAMAQYNANVNAGLMPSQQEMMQLYMSGEINEKMSEAQMMDVMAGKFAAKWGISKQEYIKIINMAQTNPKGTEAYLKSNHPSLYNRLYAANAQFGNENVNAGDPHENEYGALGEQLSALANEAFDFRNNNMDMVKHVQHNAHINSADLMHMGVGAALGLPTNELEDLYAQIIDGWPTSAECKRAIQMEDQLAARLDNWDCCKNAKEGQTICYPSWWIEGRKSENALIDAYNRKQAERWLAEVKAYDVKMTAMMKRLIELDNQLEQIRNGGEITAAYAAAKNQAYIAATHLYDFNFILEVALQFPHVVHQEESHCWTFFIKG